LNVKNFFLLREQPVFDQGIIEAITKMVGGSLMPDLDEEYGKNFHVQSS